MEGSLTADRVGLCARCAHARAITSARGSAFWLCRLADGRIYTADQALNQKLIDQVGYMPDAIDAAKRAAGVDEARVIVYHRPREYRATYYAKAEAETSSVPGSLAQLAGMLGTGPRFLYLWWP